MCSRLTFTVVFLKYLSSDLVAPIVELLRCLLHVIPWHRPDRRVCQANGQPSIVKLLWRHEPRYSRQIPAEPFKQTRFQVDLSFNAQPCWWHNITAQMPTAARKFSELQITGKYYLLCLASLPTVLWHFGCVKGIQLIKNLPKSFPFWETWPNL